MEEIKQGGNDETNAIASVSPKEDTSNKGLTSSETLDSTKENEPSTLETSKQEEAPANTGQSSEEVGELRLRKEELDKKEEDLKALRLDLENQKKILDERSSTLELRDNDISKRNKDLELKELTKELNTFFESEHIGTSMTNTLLALKFDREKSLEVAKVLATSFKTELEARISEVIASKPIEGSSGLVDEKTNLANRIGMALREN